MGREEEELKAAKRGYRDAEREGNHEEEARWANVIGDILKRRGEYVEALRWLRVDYEVSIKHLPQKQLLPTCQSLGEVYLRLDQFKEALIFQVFSCFFFHFFFDRFYSRTSLVHTIPVLRNVFLSIYLHYL